MSWTHERLVAKLEEAQMECEYSPVSVAALTEAIRRLEGIETHRVWMESEKARYNRVANQEWDDDSRIIGKRDMCIDALAHLTTVLGTTKETP